MNVYYRKTGNGKPVVLLHGFPNDGEAWNEIAPALEQNYSLIIPDLPGAGKSSLPSEPLTLELMASSVKYILEQENIEKAVLIGHSMGGYTALEFAAHYPGMVQGISLVHSSAYGDNEEKKENRRKAIQLIAKGETEKETFLRAMAGNLFAPSFVDEHPKEVNAITAKGMQLSRESLTAFYTAIMQRSDKTEVLRSAEFPVQYVIGEQDTATPMKDALEQCHLPAISKVNIYRNCGHMSMVERPKELVADLQDFLRHCF